MAKILYVADDIETADLWIHSLCRKGFQVDLLRWSCHLPDREQLYLYNLIVIDIAETSTDYHSLVNRLRRNQSSPILLYLSEHRENELLKAYRAGVSECIVKPIGIQLFQAKVQAWLRQCKDDENSLEDVKIEGFCLRVINQSVIVNGAEIRLTPLEFALLSLLIKHRNSVVSTSMIIDRVYGYTEMNNSALVKNVIYRLRNKIEALPNTPRYIVTVSGGYSFKTSEHYEYS